MKNDVARSVAQKLLQIKAIKLSPQKPFIWASGIRSPLYCDNRIALSYPAVRDLIIKEGLQVLAWDFEPIDAIAGVATAGIAHGAILADAMGLPFLYVRSKAKGHGRQNTIEGEAKAGMRVLVIEDLISTGGSSLKAVQALRDAGCHVVAVLSIFSYGFEQAEKAFNDAQCVYHSLCDFGTLLSEARNMNYLTESQERAILAWQSNPHAWQPTEHLA